MAAKVCQGDEERLAKAEARLRASERLEQELQGQLAAAEQREAERRGERLARAEAAAEEASARQLSEHQASQRASAGGQEKKRGTRSGGRGPGGVQGASGDRERRHDNMHVCFCMYKTTILYYVKTSFIYANKRNKAYERLVRVPQPLQAQMESRARVAEELMVAMQDERSLMMCGGLGRLRWPKTWQRP